MSTLSFTAFRFNFLCYLAYSLIACVLPILTVKGRAATNDAHILHLVELMQRSEGPNALTKGYITLFSHASDGKVSELCHHPNDGIALRAAWELVRRSIPDGEPSKASGESTLRPVSNERLQRFIGFAEGRLHVKPPEWWVRCFENTTYRNRQEFYFAAEFRPGRYHRTLAKIMAPREIRQVILVNSKDNALQISLTTGEVYRLPRGLLRSLENEPDVPLDQFYAIECEPLNDKRRVVAIHASTGTYAAYPLFCVDSTSSKVLWRAQVWEAQHAFLAFGGDPGPHYVQMRIKDTTVLVFGKGYGCMYVDGFSVVNGAALFRFNTTY